MESPGLVLVDLIGGILYNLKVVVKCKICNFFSPPKLEYLLKDELLSGKLLCKVIAWFLETVNTLEVFYNTLLLRVPIVL